MIMKNNPKKQILYIWAMGMWDAILSIPFFLQLKNEWYYVVLLKYHPAYFWKKMFYSLDDISQFLYDNKLFDEIIYIPHNKLKLFLFVFKNIFRFPKVYVPVKTFFSVLWARLLGKKKMFVFDNLNDTSSYQNLIQGMKKDPTISSLYQYKKYLHIPINISYLKKFGISSPFVTIFPSIFERSIDVKEWYKIICFLHQEHLSVVLIWWNREKRLYEDLQSYDQLPIINLFDKTNFDEIMTILSESKLNISANGGIMRLGHLLNRNNISLHITSWYITEPPVDNIYSFNIRKYTYPCCQPCEPKTYRFDWKKSIPSCVFAGTEREAECKKSISWEDIILYIKKIFH